MREKRIIKNGSVTLDQCIEGLKMMKIIEKNERGIQLNEQERRLYEERVTENMLIDLKRIQEEHAKLLEANQRATILNAADYNLRINY